jgi:hypothetical protein
MKFCKDAEPSIGQTAKVWRWPSPLNGRVLVARRRRIIVKNYLPKYVENAVQVLKVDLLKMSMVRSDFDQNG